MVRLHIANTVTDLVHGDVQEHLPLERIPLRGDVLGLGTTSGWDNGELTFLQTGPDGGSSIYKSEPSDGSIRRLTGGSGLSHFPYVCFSDDATSLRRPVPAELLSGAGGRPLQETIGGAIAAMTAAGSLERAPLYGLRLLSLWESLVITVASKLCMGQLRRNDGLARLQALAGGEAGVGATIYERLPHFRLSAEDPATPGDPVRWLGRSLHWDGCGFYDTQPELGRVTVPATGAHLHLHGCSTDLRHGGHLHHEHPGSRLQELERLVLYPLQTIHAMASDLAIRELSFEAGELRFSVLNEGNLDASDVGVAVVIEDRWSDHRYLHLPWLGAGEGEQVRMPLNLAPGRHRLEVIVDPERRILEEACRQANNRQSLVVQIPG
ncbi:CARDB domain-containing protein [Synechococcus sp. CBW1004]|jgi:hypothetical protein|uniref:CARDB domain-containing protein n=1 Tax=Synechococcus sp. CBW1004 TaxID=1353136 RepID=UPI0018CFABB2|nr:CARDB domain-containing protein [Synechococcus sp. CBW1004]QPN63403.1 hypothetical protein H8F25_00385 [Synechococcus sp. CBW1004]